LKITKSYLKRIIKEEAKQVMEMCGPPPDDGGASMPPDSQISGGLPDPHEIAKAFEAAQTSDSEILKWISELTSVLIGGGPDIGDEGFSVTGDVGDQGL